MLLKDLAARYGHIALIVLAFGFVAGIVAGPLLQKAGLRGSVTAAQDQPMPGLLDVKVTAAPGRRG